MFDLYRSIDLYIKRLIPALAVLLILSACAPENKCLGSWKNEAPLQILFIGNSYTYTNDLPGTFTRLACSAGYKAETDTAAEGGWTLEDHAGAPQTLEKIGQKQWDMVILQDQSSFPVLTDYRINRMYPAVRLLVKKIKNNGSQAMLFNTWAHRSGLPEAGLNTAPEMQVRLNQGYTGISLELGITIVPVGDAWMKAVSHNPPLDLWQEDGSHPNEMGTYLAACVFYAGIYRQDPRALTYYGNLSAETAHTLQSIAAEIVLKQK